MYSIPQSNHPVPPVYDDFQNYSRYSMDFTCFNTEIATRRHGPWPELSYPLTEEELDDLWFFYVLEFGHLDITVRVISSGP